MNKPKQKITINDLAAVLKTSPSTVSRALKGHPKISEEMKKKVKDAALNMGYIQSIQKNIQKNFNNKLIGIVLPNAENTKYQLIIESARKVIEDNGYNVIVCLNSDSGKCEKEQFQILRNLHVGGIISSLTLENKNPDYIEETSKHIPVVLVDRINFDFKGSKLMIDHFQAGFRGVMHLLNIGCNTIAHIGGNLNCPLTKQISAGYKTALKQNNKKVIPEIELFSDQILDDVVKATELIYGRSINPDAIIVDDIKAAQKLISTLQFRKIKIPEEIAVIAIGDEHDYLLPNLSLTTIHLPYRNLGAKAAETLLNQLNNKEFNSNNELLIEPFKLNTRNSTLK